MHLVALSHLLIGAGIVEDHFRGPCESAAALCDMRLVALPHLLIGASVKHTASVKHNERTSHRCKT
jgi:hypothetical protein